MTVNGRREWTALTLFFLAHLATDVAYGQSCSETNVNRCVNYFTILKTADDNNYIPLNETQLTQVCSEYRLFDQCMKPFEKQCNQQTRLVLEGIDLAYDYLCTDGFEVRVRNYECYANPKVHRGAEMCHTTYKSEERRILQRLSTAYSTSQKKQLLNDLCRAVHNLVSCLKQTLEDQCNKEVAEMQANVERLFLKPTLSYINCQESTTCTSSLCQNGGWCSADRSKCICRQGYNGTYCQTKSTTCTSSLCQNGGWCSADRSKCICPWGYSGTYCQTKSTTSSSCSAGICHNGGRCSSDGSRCICPFGYRGANCQTKNKFRSSGSSASISFGLIVLLQLFCRV